MNGRERIGEWERQERIKGDKKKHAKKEAGQHIGIIKAVGSKWWDKILLKYNNAISSSLIMPMLSLDKINS